MNETILNWWWGNRTLPIIFKEMKLSIIEQILKSNVCDYNNAYILKRADIAVILIQVSTTKILFKNCAPFSKSITKIDGATIDDAEDLVLSIYNLIEYSSGYSETTGSLWFHSKDEAANFNANIANDNDVKF